jgi:hypothetical protein
LWPTPDVRGFTNDGLLEMLAKMASSREEWSQMAFRKGASAKQRLWPTPDASAFGAVDVQKMLARRERIKATAKNGNGFGLTIGQAIAVSDGGPLNPEWVEWLMGFPAGWSALELSEMPSSRRSRKSSGEQSYKQKGDSCHD